MSPNADASPHPSRPDTVGKTLAKLASEPNLTRHLPWKYFRWSAAVLTCLYVVYTRCKWCLPVYILSTATDLRGHSTDPLAHWAENTNSRPFMEKVSLPRIQTVSSSVYLHPCLKALIRSPPHPPKPWFPPLGDK